MYVTDEDQLNRLGQRSVIGNASPGWVTIYLSHRHSGRACNFWTLAVKDLKGRGLWSHRWINWIRPHYPFCAPLGSANTISNQRVLNFTHNYARTVREKDSLVVLIKHSLKRMTTEGDRSSPDRCFFHEERRKVWSIYGRWRYSGTAYVSP